MAKITPEFDRFRAALTQIVSVPKTEIDRRQAEYQKQRSKRKTKG